MGLQRLYRTGRSAGFVFMSILVSLLLFNNQKVDSQFYTTGEDPSSLKWYQINTDHFQVIYPQEFESEARRMTSLLEFYYDYNSARYNHYPDKIPVILHNQSVLSNGYVVWAPKRMEVVTTPSPDNYPDDYLKHLALHEFRHVVQIDKLQQGITKILSYLFGQQAGAVTGLMPLWFIEGDAVDAETSLSLSGRGRLPSFEMEMKAILGDNEKLFPYEKAFFGSYRDYIPDRYQLGYQIVSYGRHTYGDELWENMINYTARKPYSMYPFYFGMKKHAGIPKSTLYKDTYEKLREHWKKQSESRIISEFDIVNRPVSKHYTRYRFPKYINDSMIFAVKSGIDQISEFVLIGRDGNEELIHTPGYYYPASFSVADGKIVWAEIIRDMRWDRRSYSVIKTLEIGQQTEKILTWQSRYFSPDLSVDGERIVVVEVNTINQSALVILDTDEGLVLDSIPSPGNNFLQYPVWSTDESKVFVTAQTGEGKCIMQYELESKQWEQLFFSGFEDIVELCASDNYLLFRGTFSGIDNIYSLNLADNEVYRITSSRFGAFNPEISANEDRIVYSDYTSLGFNIVEADFDQSDWVALSDLPENKEQLNTPTDEEESKVPAFIDTISTSLRPVPFRKYTDLFQFHSWSPFYFNYDDPAIDNIEVSPGLSLLSQNKLGTAVSMLAYQYNISENTHYLRNSFFYTGFYPVFKLGVDFGGDPFVESPPAGVDTLVNVSSQLTYRLKTYLPLNLSTNKMISGMQPSVEVSHNRSHLYYSNPIGYRSGLTYMDYRLYGYSYLKTGVRDILPRWGGIINVRYVDTPFEDEQLGSVVSAQGTLYVPGLLRHHTLQLRLALQKQNPLKFSMGSLITMPRGYYESLSFEEHPERLLSMRKFSLDYVLPLAYPDMQIWRLAYFKRIRADLFYDYVSGQNFDMENKIFQSVGMDLRTDVHMLHIFFPFNTGIRIAYIPEKNKTLLKFLFTIDLNQF